MRFLLPLVIALAVGAQQRQPAAGRPPSPSAVKAAVSRSDSEIEKTIQSKFAKSKIARNRFQVKVQGGVATIEGSTDVIQHKAVATRLARAAGARQVINNVKVSEKAKQNAADKLAAARRVTVKKPEGH